MKMPKLQLDIGNLFYNKRFVLPFSVVMAFVLWLVVMINQNPVREQTFTDITATVSIDNTVASEMGLGIVSDITSQKFTVVLSGPNYIVSALRSEDFLLTVDAADVSSAGTYSLSVIGTRNSAQNGYTFVSISPNSIDVTFDYFDTREYTVTPRLAGVAAANGLIAENPVVTNSDNSTLTIRGPRTLMDRIRSVGAYAEVNRTLSATQTYDAGIVLYDENDGIIYRYAADGRAYDANDNLVENTYLTIGFTSVKVTAPISKRATVRVKPAFSNLPSGMKADSISCTVDHDEVSVIGTPDIIDSLSEIALSAIDITNISLTSSSFEVSAILPDGVKLLDNIEYFTVTIDTSGYAERTFTVSNVKYTGLGSSLSAKNDGSIRNVRICGPASMVASLTASDLYATLDLTDRSAGEHTISAVIRSDKYNMIWQVGTYNTTVRIN